MMIQTPVPEPSTASDPPPDAGLEELRMAIDQVDRSLVALIAARCGLARSAGARKRADGLPRFDPGQEARVVRRGAVRARNAGIDEEAVRRMFWQLIDLSRRVQTEESR